MNANIFSNISSSINTQNEALLINLDKTINILCRVFVKNLKLFLRMYYAQSTQILNRYSKATFFDLDAGDMFNNYICLYPSAKNPENNVLITDKDFRQITFSFYEILKTPKFSQLRVLTDEHKDDYVMTMWECCKYLIIPIRLNYQTIPPIEKENVLRKWISTVFTLPFFNIYTDRYSEIYPHSVELLQKLYSIFVLNKDGNFSFTEASDRIEKLDDKVIDSFIGPLSSESNLTDTAIRMFVVVMLYSSIDIVKKYCPNIHECKQINPGYSGSWINSFDNIVSEQIRKISSVINNIAPK